MDARQPKRSRGKAPRDNGRRSLNLSLDVETWRRLRALALLEGTTASALVTAWTHERTKGLVFHLRAGQAHQTPQGGHGGPDGPDVLRIDPGGGDRREAS